MKQFIIWAAVVLVVFSAGFFSSEYVNSRENKTQDAEYSLLAKRLFLENPNDVQFNFSQLKSSLEEDLFSGYGPEDSERVSIYFEYLPSGVSININEELQAVGASLLKTTIAMMVYKLVETGTISLNDQITVTQDHVDESYGDFYKTAVGNSYTIDELLDVLLKRSDNTASEALKSVINKHMNLLDVLYANGIDPVISNDEQKRLRISTREYSRLLKCVYLSCYNTREHSQQLLTKLTDTIFEDRLTKLLPETTTVAHKIGVSGNQYQSDCGIVYANEGKSNYVLCVIVEGQDPEASEEIARISYRVHSYVTELTDSGE